VTGNYWRCLFEKIGRDRDRLLHSWRFMAIHGERRTIRAINNLNHGDRFQGYQKI
jgi:hypothetical protein